MTAEAGADLRDGFQAAIQERLRREIAAAIEDLADLGLTPSAIRAEIDGCVEFALLHTIE